MKILEDYNESMIVGLRESLHTIVNDVVASIKMTNPDQAVKKSDFLVQHIFDGLFKEYIGKNFIFNPNFFKIYAYIKLKVLN